MASDVVVHPLRVLDEKFLVNEVAFRVARPALTMILDGAGLRREDGTIDAELVRAIVAERIPAEPAMLQRLMRVAFGLATPAWVPAGTVDLDWHVTILPGTHPAGPDASLLAGAANRLDPDRPLWSFTVADLDDGTIAIVGVIHHSVGDGIQGVRMVSCLLADQPAMPDTARKADGAAPGAAVGRAPRTQLELVRGHYAAWRSQHATAGDAWRDYRRKPVAKRLKRTAGRLTRPLKNLYLVRSGRAEQLIPPRQFRTFVVPAPVVKTLASRFGASPTALTVSAAFSALAAVEPESAGYALSVPLSLGREASARNHISMVRIEVGEVTDFAGVVASVSDSLRSAVRTPGSSGKASTVSPGDEAGYASHLPMHPRRQYFGPAEVTSITLWPVLDLDDRMAVFTTSYAASFAVAVVTTAATDIDRVTDALARVFDPSTAPAGAPVPAERSEVVPGGV